MEDPTVIAQYCAALQSGLFDIVLRYNQRWVHAGSVRLKVTEPQLPRPVAPWLKGLISRLKTHASGQGPVRGAKEKAHRRPQQPRMHSTHSSTQHHHQHGSHHSTLLTGRHCKPRQRLKITAAAPQQISFCSKPGRARCK